MAAEAEAATGYSHLHLIWYDPANIWLVEVFDYLDFSYTGSQVVSYTPRYPGTRVQSQDGFPWKISYEGHSSGYVGSTQAYASTYGNYYNDTFCRNVFHIDQTTWVYTSPTQANGFGDGSKSASINTWASGGCTNLIHWFYKWE